MTETGLRVAALDAGYDGHTVLHGVDVVVPTGRVTALVGPNASGKSTLLRACARLLAPRAGAVVLDGRAVHQMPTRELARRLGLLPQAPVAPEGITVVELVARGRSPHQSWWRSWSDADERAVAAALEATGTADLADRPVDTLSGGQRQRAWVALALAQQTELLLLDEPTAYLDLHHQLELLDLLCRLNREQRRTIVVVLHDLNQACRFADHLVVLEGGRVVGAGAPGVTLTETLVRDVFSLACRVVPDPVAGTPMVVPLSTTPVPAGARMAPA